MAQSRHGRTALDVGAGLGSDRRVMTGIRWPGHEPPQIPDAVPGMRAVPRHSARFPLPVDHEHPLDAQPAQLDRGSQPCGPGPDDEHVGRHVGQRVAGRHVGRPLAGSGPRNRDRAPSSSATSAPQ